MGPGGAETDEEIVDGLFIGGDFVFSDIDADDAGVEVVAEILDPLVDAGIVEAHAVDDGVVFYEAEEAGTRVAGLGDWGERADLDVTEAVGGQGVDAIGFLVEAGGEAEAIGELEAHGADGFLVASGGIGVEDAKIGPEAEAGHRGVVSSFGGGEAEEEESQKPVRFGGGEDDNF